MRRESDLERQGGGDWGGGPVGPYPLWSPPLYTHRFPSLSRSGGAPTRHCVRCLEGRPQVGRGEHSWEAIVPVRAVAEPSGVGRPVGSMPAPGCALGPCLAPMITSGPVWICTLLDIMVIRTIYYIVSCFVTRVRVLVAHRPLCSPIYHTLPRELISRFCAP